MASPTAADPEAHRIRVHLRRLGVFYRHPPGRVRAPAGQESHNVGARKGKGAKANRKNCVEDLWYCTKSNDFTFNLEGDREGRHTSRLLPAGKAAVGAETRGRRPVDMSGIKLKAQREESRGGRRLLMRTQPIQFDEPKTRALTAEQQRESSLSRLGCWPSRRRRRPRSYRSSSWRRRRGKPGSTRPSSAGRSRYLIPAGASNERAAQAEACATRLPAATL